MIPCNPSDIAAVGSEARARGFMSAAAPRSADVHIFESDGQHHLFVANGSQIFDIDSALFSQLGAAISANRVGELLTHVGVGAPALVDDEPLRPPPLHALSLAVAQKCNLGCDYCYARQGDFGGAPRNMSLETANKAVDLLLSETGDGGKATLAFLGGDDELAAAFVR